jgi:uridine kinase
LFDHFSEWQTMYHDNPLRQDAHKRAMRVHRLLEQIIPVEDDTFIPGDSLLREFIGGSIYKY